jgi:hypothetical protein
VEFGQQPLVALRLLHRVQILPLQILHQPGRHRVRVGQLPHQHRHLVQRHFLGRPPAPLAGDDLVAPIKIRLGPDQQRLQNAALGDRIGQLLERRLVHLPARLERAWLQQIHRQALHPRRVHARRRRRVPQQRRQTAPQPFWLLLDHAGTLLARSRFKNSAASAR